MRWPWRAAGVGVMFWEGCVVIKKIRAAEQFSHRGGGVGRGGAGGYNFV